MSRTQTDTGTRVKQWARDRGVKAEFGAGSAVLLKANEPFKGSVESKSTEWAVMVSQGDITLVQKITQPISLWFCWSSMWERGEGGVPQPPAHCAGTGPPFRGKTGLLSPPRPGREFRDENSNEIGSPAIFVSKDRTGSNYTKPH